MNFSTAVLFLYLIFTPFTIQQKKIPAACGKEKLTVETKNEKLNELKEYLGIKIDEQNNTDEMNSDMEEKISGDDVPLPDGLENPEYGPQSEGSSLAENKEKSIAEVQFTNSQNRLRLFEYGEENLSIEKNNDCPEIISVNKDLISRIKYDSNYNIIEKIVWKNSTSSKDSVIIKSTNYIYKDGLEKKILSQINENYLQDKKIIETFYDDNANPIEADYSHFVDDPDEVKKYADEQKKKDDQKKDSSQKNEKIDEPQNEKPKQFTQKKILDKKTIRKFDGANRVLEEEQTTYFEVPDPLRFGKTKPSYTIEKNVYEYTEKSKVPDLKFYENGQLRLKIEYIDNETDEKMMYFNNNYSVKTKYSEGKKVLEIIYLEKNELRRQKFE